MNVAGFSISQIELILSHLKKYVFQGVLWFSDKTLFRGITSLKNQKCSSHLLSVWNTNPNRNKDLRSNSLLTFSSFVSKVVDVAWFIDTFVFNIKINNRLMKEHSYKQ